MLYEIWRSKVGSLTKVGFRSTGIGNGAPRWGNAGRTRLASDEGPLLAAAGPGSTQPCLQSAKQTIGGLGGFISSPFKSTRVNINIVIKDNCFLIPFW